jgi:hypothetical protein
VATNQARAYLKFKAGAVVPKTAIIACAAVNAANQLGFAVDIVVTSGNDSTHMRGSKHYQDEALDFRTKTLTRPQKETWIVALRKRLGPEYQVILEAEGGTNEHLHVEFDPA